MAFLLFLLVLIVVGVVLLRRRSQSSSAGAGGPVPPPGWVSSLADQGRELLAPLYPSKPLSRRALPRRLLRAAESTVTLGVSGVVLVPTRIRIAVNPADLEPFNDALEWLRARPPSTRTWPAPARVPVPVPVPQERPPPVPVPVRPRARSPGGRPSSAPSANRA
jgi:hypothetical protein